jgi:hypothetical protein
MHTERVSRSRSVAPQDVRLAEFAVLRQEIAQRTSLQHALMVLNLTAAATVAGLVLGRNADRSLILVVPFLSSALGLLWCGHHVDIARIGAYIRFELWDWVPSWEHWISQRPHAGRWATASWSAIALPFCGIPAGALAIGLPLHRDSFAIWMLWAAGASTTIFTTIRFAIHIRTEDRFQHYAAYGGDRD